MARTLLVTGTDTGVGKTLVTAWLASQLTPFHRVAVIKAVQTGARDPSLDGDEAFYRTALGHKRHDSLTIRTLMAFPEPFAPTISANQSGQTLSYQTLVQECREVAFQHDVTLIEGAGGLLVPLSSTATFAELAADISAGLVLVVRAGLGTINHTALTIEAALQRNLHVELIVCNRVQAPAQTVETENLRFFQDRYPTIPLARLNDIDYDSSNPLDALSPQMLGTAPSFLAKPS